MDYISFLRRLISTPSLSRDEGRTADLIAQTLTAEGFTVNRHLNNVWTFASGFDPAKPTLLLNSHHDTVKPSPAYSRNPFDPTVEGDCLYGLGSNDAGASVVSLCEVAARVSGRELPFNVLLAITAEEEVTGEGGMRAFLPHIAEIGVLIDMALVGEPTAMQPAIAERGLVVLDAVTRGCSGHAARNEGVNALYKAMADIDRLRSFRFPQQSAVLGPVTLQVTQIQAGTQHNVVPDTCRWVVDVRTTDAFTNEQTVELLRGAVPDSRLTPRSTRVRASVISSAHPLVKAAKMMGKDTFVSPTTSDMSQMAAFPSLKMGPGLSRRSHTADEFVLVSEIESAIADYIVFLDNLSKLYETDQTLE